MKYELDLRNLLCPLPVIKTQNKINQLKVGDRLEVKCSDPGTLQDIPSWCRIFGHKVIDINQTQTLIKILIEVC